MENLEKTVIELDARAKSNTKRLDRLEAATEAVNELATSVKLLAQSMENMSKELKQQGERVTVLERIPGERWNTMTRTIFTSLVSTLAGGLVGALIAILV